MRGKKFIEESLWSFTEEKSGILQVSPQDYILCPEFIYPSSSHLKG